MVPDGSSKFACSSAEIRFAARGRKDDWLALLSSHCGSITRSGWPPPSTPMSSELLLFTATVPKGMSPTTPIVIIGDGWGLSGFTISISRVYSESADTVELGLMDSARSSVRGAVSWACSCLAKLEIQDTEPSSDIIPFLLLSTGSPAKICTLHSVADGKDFDRSITLSIPLYDAPQSLLSLISDPEPSAIFNDSVRDSKLAEDGNGELWPMTATRIAGSKTSKGSDPWSRPCSAALDFSISTVMIRTDPSIVRAVTEGPDDALQQPGLVRLNHTVHPDLKSPA